MTGLTGRWKAPRKGDGYGRGKEYRKHGEQGKAGVRGRAGETVYMVGA